ncbi:WXG100 family type VII secretion target [uncultured Leifsonia sp.]|uniref:WXG100 family type VII secretion target n=1 Tax=uncultured Leifsonia sp. TaxID=340359 RepID=UPI0028D58C7C|nr:WXG100 family type VII secretion target [uncultured Leifsonia sp.]
MSNITVSYAEIETAASQLGAGREEITTRLQSMQTQISNLVTSGFVTDQASGKFNEAYTTYTTSANTLITQLNDIQQFLTGTANAMRDLDAQIAARIN